MYKICHTEESTRRQREMEQGLLEALGSQPYEKITLTQLCAQLQVPRKTFYRYFPTKEDCLLALIDHALSDCNDVALGGWNGETKLNRESLLRFFRYWKNYARFLDAVRDNGFSYLLLDRTTKIVDKMKKGKQSESFALDQMEYFIAHGLMLTVLRWHYHSFQSTSEEMAEIFGKFLESGDIAISRLLL